MNNFENIEDLNVEFEITKDSKPSLVSDSTPYITTKLSNVDVMVHASMLSKVMSGDFGLSHSQILELEDLEKRKAGDLLGKSGKPLKFEGSFVEKYNQLVSKRDNPTLTKGTKTHLNELIVTDLYGIRKFSDSKETRHGNDTEQFSIDTLNMHTGRKWAKEDKSRTDKDLMLTGTCDVYDPSISAVIDIKNPYHVHSFDSNRKFDLLKMHEDASGKWVWSGLTGDARTDAIKKEYYWQGQAYMQLYDVENFYLIYTLNENYYMQFHEEPNVYEKFGLFDRVIIHKMTRCREAISMYKERIPAIQKAIRDIKIDKVESMNQTAIYLNELKTK